VRQLEGIEQQNYSNPKFVKPFTPPTDCATESPRNNQNRTTPQQEDEQRMQHDQDEESLLAEMERESDERASGRSASFRSHTSGGDASGDDTRGAGGEGSGEQVDQDLAKAREMILARRRSIELDSEWSEAFDADGDFSKRIVGGDDFSAQDLGAFYSSAAATTTE